MPTPAAIPPHPLVTDWITAGFTALMAIATLVTAVIARIALRRISRVVVDPARVEIVGLDVLEHPIWRDGTEVATGLFVRVLVHNHGPKMARGCLGKVLAVTDANSGHTLQPFEPQRLAWGGDQERVDIAVGDREVLTVGFKVRYCVSEPSEPDEEAFTLVLAERVTNPVTPWRWQAQGTSRSDPSKASWHGILTDWVSDGAAEPQFRKNILDRSNKPNCKINLPTGKWRIDLRVSGENFEPDTRSLLLQHASGYRNVDARLLDPE